MSDSLIFLNIVAGFIARPGLSTLLSLLLSSTHRHLKDLRRFDTAQAICFLQVIGLVGIWGIFPEFGALKSVYLF
jgi:hypothetical protein